MTRRERLIASLRGEPVDRPPVCFYEINGHTEDPDNPDPFNIFNHPSWQPLLRLAREQSDRILLAHVPFCDEPSDPLAELTESRVWIDENGSRHRETRIRAGDRLLTSHTRHDPEVNTGWNTEHLLKNIDDFRAWLALPERPVGGTPDPGPVEELEHQIGDTGLVALDTADPLCMVAPLFHMEEYTVIALTEPELFRRALDRAARWLLPRIEATAKAVPGRLWRIYGPEYASPPYLPPRLFKEYVVDYVTPMVDAIQRHGGYARIHSHGRLKDILDHIAATGCTGLDPIEPPPQGDVSLAYVREHYGRQLTLFGNIEVSDIENLPTPQFAEKVRTALDEGTRGDGRGFVLMPSAAPYGRVITDLTRRNYETMVELTNQA